MKEGFIHVCFVIDKSGSMYSSTSDVVGGFKRIVEEQKAVKDGTCAVSLYTFASNVEEVYLGKDINDIDSTLQYHADGLTAMNDGIGMAIDKVGKWLSDMKEEDRPEKNLIVIMTDGQENNSVEYSIDRVRDMIKEQTEKYNWSFMYLGTDITDTTYADTLGVMKGVSTRSNYSNNYTLVNSLVTEFRGDQGPSVEKYAKFCASMNESLDLMNAKYAEDTGINITTSADTVNKTVITKNVDNPKK